VTVRPPTVSPGRPAPRDSWTRRVNQLLVLAGLEPFRLLHTARTLPVYLRNYRTYRRLQDGPTPPDFPVTRHVPMLHDRTASAGRRGAYFHQDLLVARRILERRPERHVDIGSRIDGFVAHVALFREIEVLDIRPMSERIPNIVFRQVDFMREDQPLVNYCDSVSCLHALEHFGLGSAEVPALVGTLGKAFGSFGAFVAGDAGLVETLIQRARTYIYTTALPPAVAAATREALEVAASESWRRARVLSLARRFRVLAAEAGIPLADSATPIQPVRVGPADAAVAASARLLERGYYVAAIRPPTVPADSSRLRIALSAAHRDADVEGLVAALADALRP